ncbi:unnamed protein product [Rotaria socialis]|uniref:Tyrosine-protein kinase ephrin type A/B receptor-like domain-containing protein n=2 Tax=Rotaria socialis TaxID=392032 RepID=A0A818V294_9BILA|nr:unnamed protein product [Rotaria socialis]CAF4223513.1 unnamed protein product [Rotaria socialis]
MLFLSFVRNAKTVYQFIETQTDSDYYGTRFVSNNYMVVLSENQNSHFRVVADVLGHFSCVKFFFFGENKNEGNNYYVINVAVGRNQNETQLYFIYLMASRANGYQSLTVGRIQLDLAIEWNNEHGHYELIGCYNEVVNWTDHSWNIPLEPQLLSNMQVDLKGEYAYIFFRDIIFTYDINANKMKYVWMANEISPYLFNPHALDIGETNDETKSAIIPGYAQEEKEVGKSLPIVCLFELDPPSNMTLISNITLENTTVTDSIAFFSNYDDVISVVIHDRTKKVLVSMPYLGKVYLLSFNSTDIVLIRSFTKTARSIAWLDDDGILAAFLILDDPTLPWARSKILVINTSANNDEVIYFYPNNQQILLPIWGVPSFVRISTTSSHQLLFLDSDGWIGIVPKSPPGHCARMNELFYDQTYFEKCPPGTYKSSNEASPCQVCPPGTKSSMRNNSNGEDATSCSPCSLDSFCPLASLNDVNISLYPIVDDSYTDPDVPSWDSFDDILVNNAFSINGNSGGCVVKSPMFWTCIVLGICLIILVTMGILFYFPESKIYFARLRFIFQQTDLIGEGRMWIGGLVSFAIMILVIYAFWFSLAFIKLYPIEESGDANFACNTGLRNSKFTSALRLLSSKKSQTDAPMFQMLDDQQFQLTVDFIQTGFVCNNIHAHEYVGLQWIDLKPNRCFRQEDNATSTISIDLHDHQMGLMFNLADKLLKSQSYNK